VRRILRWKKINSSCDQANNAVHRPNRCEPGAIDILRKIINQYSFFILSISAKSFDLRQMLFLDGVYIGGTNGLPVRFRWVKAPTSDEPTQPTHTIARRIAGYLGRQGLLERDAGGAWIVPRQR
jgi:hypothetical protein